MASRPILPYFGLNSMDIFIKRDSARPLCHLILCFFSIASLDGTSVHPTGSDMKTTLYGFLLFLMNLCSLTTISISSETVLWLNPPTCCTLFLCNSEQAPDIS